MMHKDRTVTAPFEPITELERSRLGELYLRHGPGALRIAYLLTGEQRLAEDLVQEAFVRLAGRLVHVRDPSAFNAYLRQTILNLTRMHFRRKRLERRYLRREESLAPMDTAPMDLDLREDIWKALQGLPPRQRAALVLRYYEDLAERDAAEVLACRPGTYRALVAKGLRTLRAQITGERDG